MSLINYWPTINEIERCIQSRAESGNEDVLLAVHQPSPLVYLKIGPDGRPMPDSRTPASENNLLDWLLGPAPEGSVVVPITGASGIGKSHLIRIIAARLRQHPDANRYLVILIPKTASLREVVKLILSAEPLQDKKYDHIKSEFSKAIAEELTMKEAVIHFEGYLQIELINYENKLTESLERDPTNISLSERIGHARNLPLLMRDASTVEHFRSKVLPRIIKRSVEGVVSKEGEVDEIDSTTSQFHIDDFNLSGLELTEANLNVSRYYNLGLVSEQGKGKAVAVEVLNSVIDQATSKLYKLNESLGGMTLAEVILEIRRLLVNDSAEADRELVILVEDFAALIGIQETLGKVLIQEGNPLGVKKYATIRSAIAVTDGYLLGKQTLATRAAREWVIESQLVSEEEILSRTSKMVAAYLNALRIGKSDLRTYYQDKLNTNDIYESPPVYNNDGDDEDTVRLLNAFGYEGEIPLFPFTKNAIERLVRSSLTRGSLLTFNPRFIILNVVSPVLSFGRSSFIDKSFPPPSIVTTSGSKKVAAWVQTLSVSEDQKNRYERLITTWGNDPETEEAIKRVPSEIFEAFSLPIPDTASRNAITTAPEPPPSVTTSVATPIDNTILDRIRANDEVLEKWVRNGDRLPQNVALIIRKNLVLLLNRRIDWIAERCIKRPLQSNQIAIQNAGGEGAIVTLSIKIEIEDKDKTGKLRIALNALLRQVDVYKDNSNYPDMDDDMVVIANFIDELLPQALKIIKDELKKQNESAINAVANNSRLLGISSSAKSLNSLYELLFSAPEKPENLISTEIQSFVDLREMQTSALEMRGDLQGHLISGNGCFQGTTGAKAWGIDIVRIYEEYAKKSSEIELACFPEDIKNFLRNNKETDISRNWKKVISDSNVIVTEINTKLNADFDKNSVTQALKELAHEFRNAGAWDGSITTSYDSFIKLCDAFNSSPLKETLATLKVFEGNEQNNESEDKKTALGGKMKLNPLLLSKSFIFYAERIMLSAENYASRIESQFGGVNPQDKINEIQDLFNDISMNLGSP